MASAPRHCHLTAEPQAYREGRGRDPLYRDKDATRVKMLGRGLTPAPQVSPQGPSGGTPHESVEARNPGTEPVVTAG